METRGQSCYVCALTAGACVGRQNSARTDRNPAIPDPMPTPATPAPRTESLAREAHRLSVAPMMDWTEKNHKQLIFSRFEKSVFAMCAV